MSERDARDPEDDDKPSFMPWWVGTLADVELEQCVPSEP